VLGDFDRKIHRLVAATPISHAEYAFSRFLSAFGVLVAILALWIVLQVGFYELFPLDPAERIRGGFGLWNYLLPKLLFGLPLALFVGGTSMWLGVRTRLPVLVFALPVVIVVSGIFFVWTFNPEWLPQWVNRAMQLVDPTGFRWFVRTYLSEDRGVAFYNSATLVPDAMFLFSRAVLCAVGVGAVWATGRRLAREEHEVGLAVAHDLVGLHRLGDQAHRGGRNPGLAANALGERHLVAGADGNLSARSAATRAAVDQVHAGGLEFAPLLQRRQPPSLLQLLLPRFALCFFAARVGETRTRLREHLFLVLVHVHGVRARGFALGVGVYFSRAQAPGVICFVRCLPLCAHGVVQC
jgi:hypothetical protein